MAVILLMDDQAGIREMLRETFVAVGHQFFAATDGEQGLQLCNSHPPDIVILDMFMPVKDGLETLQELRNQRPGLKIIAISGAPGGLGVLDMASKLGAQQVVRKPFTPGEILSAVNKLLQAA